MKYKKLDIRCTLQERDNKKNLKKINVSRVYSTNYGLNSFRLQPAKKSLMKSVLGQFDEIRFAPITNRLITQIRKKTRIMRFYRNFIEGNSEFYFSRISGSNNYD